MIPFRSHIQGLLPGRAADVESAISDPRPVLRLALWVVGIGFFGFMAWAALTPLSRGAHVVGKVAVESSRKLVQHKEGGIVREIRVHEGQFVKAGDVLLVLDNIQAGAAVGSVEERLVRDLAAEARLNAELGFKSKLSLPAIDDPLLSRKLQAVFPEQLQIFESRQRRYREQLIQAEARIAQLRPQMKANAVDIAALERNHSILERRLESLSPLAEDGLYPRNQLLDLESSRNRASADLAAKREEKVRLSEALREAETARSSVEALYRQEAAEQLADVQRRIADAREQLRATRDTLGRTRILAPVSGQVVGLVANTVGGVVGPGQSLMSIVPVGERLLIEAQVNPLDVDVVHPGMPAELRFPALPRRTSPLLKGKLISVSRDVMEGSPGETMPGKAPTGYFLARIEVAEAELARLKGVDITPGMPVEVLLDAGERTVLEYLVAPWTDLFSKAMRED